MLITSTHRGVASTENWYCRMGSNHQLRDYKSRPLPVEVQQYIAPFYFPTNMVGARDWNHGAESNCHCILSAACGSLTAAHLLALQCSTAIVRPWYKCGAIFIQPLRVILFARRSRRLNHGRDSNPRMLLKREPHSPPVLPRHINGGCKTMRLGEGWLESCSVESCSDIWSLGTEPPQFVMCGCGFAPHMVGVLRVFFLDSPSAFHTHRVGEYTLG